MPSSSLRISRCIARTEATRRRDCPCSRAGSSAGGAPPPASDRGRPVAGTPQGLVMMARGCLRRRQPQQQIEPHRTRSAGARWRASARTARPGYAGQPVKCRDRARRRAPCPANSALCNSLRNHGRLRRSLPREEGQASSLLRRYSRPAVQGRCEAQGGLAGNSAAPGRSRSCPRNSVASVSLGTGCPRLTASTARSPCAFFGSRMRAPPASARTGRGSRAQVRACPGGGVCRRDCGLGGACCLLSVTLTTVELSETGWAQCGPRSRAIGAGQSGPQRHFSQRFHTFFAAQSQFCRSPAATFTAPCATHPRVSPSRRSMMRNTIMTPSIRRKSIAVPAYRACIPVVPALVIAFFSRQRRLQNGPAQVNARRSNAGCVPSGTR